MWGGGKTDFDNGPQFVAKQFVGVLFPDFRHHGAGLELWELVVGPVHERIKRRREDVDVWSPWRGRPCLVDENQDECLKQELFSLSFLQEVFSCYQPAMDLVKSILRLVFDVALSFLPIARWISGLKIQSRLRRVERSQLSSVNPPSAQEKKLEQKHTNASPGGWSAQICQTNLRVQSDIASRAREPGGECVVELGELVVQVHLRFFAVVGCMIALEVYVLRIVRYNKSCYVTVNDHSITPNPGPNQTPWGSSGG